jgi:ABC-type transport system involved in Fe-S cluster assembly fused permease/ATPase subunit
MEHGRITEHGPHDDLVARGGAYAALWESWRAES